MADAIYVVDANQAVRASLKALLEICGYAVEAFESGEDLIARNGFASVVCIIMGVNLPGETGLETLQRLRESGIMTPTLIVSGNMDADIACHAQRLHVAGLFQKPVSADVLLNAIREIQYPTSVGETPR